MSNSSTTTAQSQSGYGYGKALDLSFGEAVERVKEALKTEGFGVLCEIDIKAKLKEKLGVDFRRLYHSRRV